PSTRRAEGRAFPAWSGRGGAQRRGGEVEAPRDPPSATLSRPALLHEEGRVKKLPPPRRGGVARSDGVVGLRPPQDHPSATLSRPALLHEEGRVMTPSPPRRGGGARSEGVGGLGPPQGHASGTLSGHALLHAERRDKKLCP